MAKELVITAKAPKAGKEGTLKIMAPETLDEAIQMYGAEAILTNAMANFVIKLQGNIRSAVEKGEEASAMQTRLGGSKMGVAVSKAPSMPSKNAALAYFATLTPEQKAEYVRELREAAKAQA